MKQTLHPLKSINMFGEIDDGRYRAKLTQSMRGAIRFAQRRQAAKAVKGYLTVAVSVTLDQLMEKLRADDYRCALTGLEFYVDDGGSYGPTRPSIDRINPKGPYSNKNTRVVLLGVNGLRGEGSDA